MCGAWWTAPEKGRQDTLKSKASLADDLYQQRRWPEAENMYREVLEARTRILGEEHRDTLVSRNNLASALAKQGRQHEAEEMFREVLEVMQKVLGEEHSDTLTIRNNLANALMEQGRGHEAEGMYRELLEVQKRLFGDEHPDTLAIRNNLALALYQQGRWREAEMMQREVLEARRRILGEEHPDTLHSRYNLANALLVQGRWPEAENMYREVPAARTRLLGEEHPDTLWSKRSLAHILRRQGRWNEASGLERQGELQETETRLSFLLDVRREVLGEDHPSTLYTLHNLASVVAERGSSHADRLVDAVSKLRTVVESLQLRVGEDHMGLISCRFALAKLLVQMNQPEKASEVEYMLRRLIPHLRERYGLLASFTQEATRDLVFVLEEQGKDAEEWRQLLLAMENPDRTPVFSAERESFEKFLGEEWVGTDELLRGLLGRDYPLCHGQIVKADSSNATSSSAQVCTESSANASSSENSLGNLELLEAALQEKIQERKEREEE